MIPIRTAVPTGDDADGELRYTDNVRYLPKAARAADLPVEFSMPEGSRKYLSEFSIDPEMWSLGLACLTVASDWLILTVSLFIAHRSDTQGWTPEEAKKLPLKVRVAETETGLNYEIEGEGEDVLGALRELNESAKRRKKNGKKNRG
ncbi:hypothetical protein [Promicromonospora sp. NPDC050262]|uniref:hypothetical protein n=1 Tax=Promicromonospora sp. NPDC050262 TaxID=3155036 RepID=UPI0033FC203B